MYEKTLEKLQDTFGTLNQTIWPVSFEENAKESLLSFHVNLHTLKHIAEPVVKALKR